MQRYKEFVLFAAAGVLGYLADVFTTVILEPYLGVYLARFPAFFAAATVTWVFNRSITFNGRQSVHQSIFKEYIHYLSLMVVGLVVNYVVYAISITIFKNIPYAIYLCVALGSLAGMLVNFIMSRKFIFKSSK